MTTDLTLTPARRAGNGPALVVTGEIDMSNSGDLHAAIKRETPGTDGLLVDLVGVDYIDSAGLAVLFAHVKNITVVAGPLLKRVLEVSGLPELTDVRIVDPTSARY